LLLPTVSSLRARLAPLCSHPRVTCLAADVHERLRAPTSRPMVSEPPRNHPPYGGCSDATPGTDLSADASRAAEQSRPRQGFGFAQPRSPASPRFASRRPSMLRRRCFSPTSATNALHVHPWIVRFPGIATRAAIDPLLIRSLHRDPYGPRGSRAGQAAPDRLATIRTPGERAIDARAQLRPPRAQPLVSSQRDRGRAPPTGRCSHCHGVFGREQGRRKNL